jgi:hypothetical protein
MGTLNDRTVADGNQYVLAAYYNLLLGSILRKDFSNAVTMSTDITLTDADYAIQRLNCNGADRIVKVPPGADGNHPFLLINTSSGDFKLVLKSNDATVTHALIFKGQALFVFPDGNGGYITAVEAISVSGWVPSSATWTYSSADSPTFVSSVNADMTGIISVGMRIKLIQTTTKYFIVTAVGSFSGGATLITLYGGTDYTLVNAAISNPHYSVTRAPLGFPMDQSKWTVTVTSSSDCTKASPAGGTWYGGSGLTPTGPSIDIPIGSWRVIYKAALNLTVTLGAATSVGFRSTLSTANNSESDSEFTFSATLIAPVITGGTLRQTAQVLGKLLNLASKTTYYLNLFTGAGSMTDISFLGSSVFPTKIMAECAYL